VANEVDGARHPIRASARERMRDAQRREAAALDAVTKATGRVAAEELRLTRARAERERSVASAVAARCRAVATLAAVSGIQRTALLLSEPAATVRRECRIAERADVVTTDEMPGLDPTAST
jgi:hypothetical protein